jgi:DinB family protein
MTADEAVAGLEGEINEATNRARKLIENTDGRRFTVRPEPSRWSAAECLAHLSLATESFLPVLRGAIDDAKKKAMTSDCVPHMDMLGSVLRWLMEPPARSRFKTQAPFVPRAIRAKAEALAEFTSLQSRLVEMLREAHGLDFTKMKLVSPFDQRVKYNLFSAFRIIAAHQRRHLWQAEQAVAELQAHGPARAPALH